MTRCFVTGCKSYKTPGRHLQNDRHFFKVPRDAGRLRLWKRAVPGLDVKLETSCSVCDLHFVDEDILKVFETNIRGNIVPVPRAKWVLKADAVPRLFPNCPSDLSKPAIRQEKQETSSTETPQDIQNASSKGCQTSLPITCTQETQTQEVCVKSGTELPDASSSCRTRDCGTSTDLTFYCEECGGTFVTATRLDMHKRASHRKKWLVCKCLDCSPSPNNRSHHAGHEHIQYAVKYVVCKFCVRRFHSREDFETHQRVVHKEEKSFKCDKCGRRFKFLRSLLRHEKSYCPHTA